jgi:rubrerythrin
MTKQKSEQKEGKKKTSITAQDYGYLSRLVLADLKKMKIGAAGYKEANDLYQLLRDKAKKGENAKSTKTGQKLWPKWKCLSCGEVHEKIETELKCISCSSTNVEKQVFNEE